MNNNNNIDFSISEKEFIAKQIKNICMDDVEREMDALIKICHNTDTIKPRSCIGNNIVDYFTFVQRLETKSKYDANFYDFLKNIEEFKKKKFIQTMITYYDNIKNIKKTKNKYTVLKDLLGELDEIFSLKKFKRQNEYNEMVYVWKKK